MGSSDPRPVRAWSVDLIDRTSAGNASVQWPALQQFLEWAELEGEIPVSPMRDLSGPRPAPPPVPVIETGGPSAASGDVCRHVVRRSTRPGDLAAPYRHGHSS